ncbi:uncharacterized protein L201_004248 [Kwoniella dendrophila CBS 6074]|uniref:Kinesin motor domain-containing protein n=1 Tax=Kwoniella dendrophila CBS 6074 TaxID=1295534 RepID=A0AAX4JVG4_9TREE
MDANAIRIAVRCRPWHPTKELPFVSQPVDSSYFNREGGLGTSSSSRPVAPGAIRNVVEIIDHRELDFDKPTDTTVSGKRGAPSGRRYKNRKYVFDHVFSMDVEQEEVFERTAKPLLPGVLDGYNATVFAYGATGCGKTHTISGTEEQPGIIVRTMRELFALVEDDKLKFDTRFIMSMVEIYNENIRDLLSDDYPACPPGGLKLLENEKERVKVAHVTEKTPTSVDEVMDLVMLGNERRSTSFTARNSTSSRSHLVLQILVIRNRRESDIDADNLTVTQCSTSATLSIIDLAGSEKASVNRGQRMKEGANINKSLLALSGCISALCQNPIRGQRQHVPYRDSKLTRLLKFSLGGNCRTVMINCISPSSKDIEETNNTLLWADKAKKVSTKVSRNTAGVELRTAQWIQKIVALEATIKELEAKDVGVDQRQLVLARKEAGKQLEDVQTEVNELLPMILEGTETEALWNASILQVEALDTRLADIDIEMKSGRSQDDAIKEKNHIRALIQQQDQSYRFNSEILKGREKLSSKGIGLDNLLKKSEEMRFGKDVQLAKLEHQLAILKIQNYVVKSISAAKERGLRDYIAQQADFNTKSSSLLSRFSTLLRNEVESLRSNGASLDQETFRKRLESLLNTTDQSVATLFGEAPTPISVGPARTVPISIAAPSPRKPSVRPSVSPSRTLMKAALTNKSMMPSRGNLFGLESIPSGTTTSTSTSSSASAPKKTFRWADDAGEGKIDDRSIAPDCPVFSSPSTNADGSFGRISPPSLASSPNWANKDKSGIPKAVSPLIPAPLRSLNFPSSASQPTLPALNPSQPNESTADIPAWKQMRMMQGRLGQSSIGTISEESPTKPSSSSSSPIGLGRPSTTLMGPPTSTTGLMGPPARPARPGPLGELHSVPGNSGITGPRASSSLSNSSSMSNLLRPTAASAAKANANSTTSTSVSAFANVKIPSTAFNMNGNTSINGSNSLPSRRVSLIGATRHDRAKHRASSVNYDSAARIKYLESQGRLDKDPLNNSSIGSVTANNSILSSGARRIGAPRSSMALSATSTLPRGPRQSLASTSTGRNGWK